MGEIETKIIDKEILDESTHSGIGRRDFLKGAAISAMGMGAMAALTGCGGEAEKAQADDTPTEEKKPAVSVGASDLTGWAGTPADIAAMGGSTMPLIDLNRYRQEYLDAQSDYTCEDGTVVPAVYVKARALIHTYGMGCGNTPADTSFPALMAKMDEDDAQMFIEMPFGEAFTIADLHAKTGRSIEECTELCDRLAAEGLLCRYSSDNGYYYHHIPWFQGSLEYTMSDIYENPTTFDVGIKGSDMLPNDMASTGTPVFYAIPCDKSVVEDGTVIPYDDIETILATKEKFAIAPCYCRYSALMRSGEVDDYPSLEDFATGQFEDYFSPVCDLRLETCIHMGVEADYWITKGIAREITREEALGYLQRSRDDGFILQHHFSKDVGTICSCHSRTCGLLTLWSTLGSPENIAAAPAFRHISHYNLEVDASACTSCGTCAERCPLDAISMESGAPVVNEMCFRCGQCAYVCPEAARVLTLRPEDETLGLTRNFVDDNNMKASYRFEQGLIW